MPAGASPALSRTVGVMLKNAWLQTLLKRPAEQKAHPGKYFRPAVFICDEYQSFATVGEDDPSGDEKSFALTRQSRCIPIVATQSISSLRSVLSGQEAWRALLQTLRTRIFLSLSDDSSADLASSMCGKVARMTASYSFSEQAKPGFSVVSGTAGGGRGSIGASKSFRGPAGTHVSRPAVCPPGELPGHRHSLRWLSGPAGDEALPEALLPAARPAVLAGPGGRPDMSVGMDHLKPFLPGLADILDDMDVSELMINGPGNVWVERSGEGLRPIAAPQLTADVLHRAAIHIARPLGLDPEATPILDARLADGSRVAICVPPRVASRRDHCPALRQAHLFAGAACRDRVPHTRAPRRRPGHAGRPGQYPGLRRDRERKDHIAQRPDRAPAGQ